jgi:hypothetical protein
MALHGEIKVNERTIGAWEAIRRSKHIKTVNTYDVRVYYEEPDGTFHTRRTVIAHNHGDGSLTLASEVLTWAAKQFPPKG